MGLLVDGVWRDEWYDTQTSGGRFERKPATFRDRINVDGRFPPEEGRYRLYVSLACPWSHRTSHLSQTKGARSGDRRYLRRSADAGEWLDPERARRSAQRRAVPLANLCENRPAVHGTSDRACPVGPSSRHDLFTTLVRFDAAYFGHFKCNRNRLVDFTELWDYTRALYQHQGIADTVRLDQIKTHYYGSHRTINPTGIVPNGPQIDFLAPTKRRPV